MKNSRHILVTTDFNMESLDTNMRYAKFLVEKFGSYVTLLHIVEESGIFSKIFGSSSDIAINAIKGKMYDLVDDIEKRYGITVKPVIKQGRVTQEIKKFAEESLADLIIIGTTNSDDEERVIGANTHRLIRVADSPVLTLHKGIEPKSIKHILLPIELYLSSRQKVKNAIEWAREFDAKITIISGIWDKDVPEIVHKVKVICENTREFIESKDVDVDLFMLEDVNSGGDFAIKVAQYANDPKNEVDILMVMGRDETTDFFISSTAQKVVRYSDIPVLCIPVEDLGMNPVAMF